MDFEHNGITRTVLAVIVATSAISLGSLAHQTASLQRAGADLEHGKALYSWHCEHCHGTHGDVVTCSELIPLAGLGRRPRVGLVAQFMSPSYFARGAFLEGEDARDLTAYLLALKGEKGFEDPGLLYSPRLLSKKYPVLAHYRVIDVRDKESYARAHIPNAALWPDPLDSGAPSTSAARAVISTLGSLGVRSETMVVVYDETLSPKAALVWWSLMQAGHENVATLDGGSQRWVKEGYPISTQIAPLAQAEHAPAISAEAFSPPPDQDYPVLRLRAGLTKPSPHDFDWQHTVNEGSLRTAEEIRDYFQKCEIRLPRICRIEGTRAEAAFLIYLLRLLGFGEVQFDPGSRLLQVAKPWPDVPPLR